MTGDIDAMLADHSVKGRLQSGATILAAVRVFENHSQQALTQALSEAAKLIDSHGRKWSAAMGGISDALDSHLARAKLILSNPVRIANGNESPSISNALDEKLRECGARLCHQLLEFQDGWTSPLPKLWKDRHPFLYAIALLIVGATVGWLAKQLT